MSWFAYIFPAMCGLGAVITGTDAMTVAYLFAGMLSSFTLASIEITLEERRMRRMADAARLAGLDDGSH